MALICDKQAEIDFIRVALSLAEESPGRLVAESNTDGITDACFTDRFLAMAFAGAKHLSRLGDRLTEQSLASHLGPRYRTSVAQIWPVVPVTHGYRVLAAKLREYATRRAAYDIAERIKDAAEATPDGQLQTGLVEAAAALQATYSADGSAVLSGRDVFLDFVSRLERAQSGQEDFFSIIRTGIRAWDDAVGGLPRKFVTLLGAYPGAFKSGICATIAANVAASGRRVGFFSLEDNAEWVAKRYVSKATGIPVEDMARRRLSAYELEKLENASANVANVMDKMFFDHRSGLSGVDIASSARFMVSERKCELIIVDHIGESVPRSSKKEKHEWLGENFKLIRDVAKDTGCAILVAAHLRRDYSNEEDIYRVPRMSDFADSSQLERACRLALGLFQPKDLDSEISIKVLKQNEGGARGSTFNLRKLRHCAMVE